MPTDDEIARRDREAGRQSRQGRRQASTRQSPLLPDFAASSRLYMRMLMSFLGASFPPEVYAGAQASGGQAAAGRDAASRAERLRGIALSHRDWVIADGARARSARAMARTVQEVRRGDLPDHADAGLSARSFARAGKPPHPRSTARSTPYADQLAWPGIATLPGLPATAIPIGDARRKDCRSACRSSAPGWRIARR